MKEGGLWISNIYVFFIIQMWWFYCCAAFWWSFRNHMKFLECKRLTNCNRDGWLLFDPSDENPLLCDCCTCHRSFHCPIYDIILDSGACIKRFNDGINDCQSFYHNRANAYKCGAYGCYKLLHKPLISPSCSHKIIQNLVVNTDPLS